MFVGHMAIEWVEFILKLLEECTNLNAVFATKYTSLPCFGKHGKFGKCLS